MARKKRIYFETEEIVTTKKKGWIEIDLDYTQVYHTMFEYTKNLKNKYCRLYIDWIISKADHNNMVPHNPDIIKQFVSEFKEPPSAGTVRNAISELVKNKIFIKHSNNSYQLNPAILWGDEVAKRIEHVKAMRAEDIDYELLEEPMVEYKKL
jgi:hypothetical protein